MNKYLMAVRHYFRGFEEFEIEAENKEEARKKAAIFVRQDSRFISDNYDKNDIKVIKKIKPKKENRI